MADPMGLRRQAWLRAWKTGCQTPERADGRGAANLVRLGICSWAEQFDHTAVDVEEFSAGSDAAAWVEAAGLEYTANRR
jgi:hypothetical protein